MGVQELIVVLVILLLFFGGKKLPELAGSMGQSIREFRKASEDPDAIVDDPAETGAKP